MTRTDLLNFLADHDLSLTDGFYDVRYHGFTWVVASLDQRTKYGDITLTCEKIEREWPDISAELAIEVKRLMERTHPGWFHGRRTFDEMTDKL